jgi:hypothetical protein
LESGEAIEVLKNPWHSKTQTHPTTTRLASFRDQFTPRDLRDARPQAVIPTLPGTGIFGPETEAENRTDPRTETADHKTRVKKARQRRAFPISLYTMAKQ